MMIKSLFFLVFIFQGNPDTTLAISIVETSSSDSLKTEMVLRSEDLIWPSQWNFISLDRMSYKVNTGVYGYYGPQPTYLLDDIPIDPTLFGMNYSQLLPVSFNQIQKLNAHQGIGISEGVSYNSGLLKINSVSIKDGFSVYGSGQFGHNSEEPGPWVFDSNQVTPNVERLGPWADAGISLKIGNWYAKSVLRSHRYLHINQFVQTRTKNLVGFPQQGNWPNSHSISHLGLVETGFHSNNLNIRLQAILSESEDFLYFQPLAREIPTDFTMQQYSAVASFSRNKIWGFRTMLQYREKETGYRSNRFEHEFDWRQSSNIGRASVYLNSEWLQFDIGTEYEVMETKAGGLSGGNDQFIDLYLDQQIEIASMIRFGTYSALTLHDDVKPLRANAFLEVDLLRNWTTAFQGSYSELLPEFSNPVDGWVGRGYDILDRLEILYFIPQEIPVTRYYSLSHQNRVEFSNTFSAELNVQLLNHLNFQVPFQDAWYDLSYSTMPGAYFLITDNSGQRLNISVDANLQWPDSFYHKTGIYRSGTLDGDVAYKSYWKTVPEYLIRHTTIFTPYSDLEIRLNIQYQTESVWDEFRRLEGKLNRTFHVQFPYSLFNYSYKIPSGLNMDLTLSKWMWKQRIRAVLMLGNLFNKKYQTHPIGTREGFGYMLRLELRI